MVLRLVSVPRETNGDSGRFASRDRERGSKAFHVERSPDMVSQFDVLIVGQGLAGTALAWSLKWRGARVLVIDREEPVTSSKIAAGLITPITGQKLTQAWRYSELWPAAVAFYDRVQSETRSRFFRRTSAVRLFISDSEGQLFDRRLAAGEFRGEVRRSDSLSNPAWRDGINSGFVMGDGAQLDVLKYLSTSRQTFERDGGYAICDLSLPSDIEMNADRVSVPRMGVVAKTMIFCEGAAATHNPWFHEVQFKPAKGEILTLRIPGYIEGRVIHRGVWLAPVGDDLFKAGATYDWKNLDSNPTPAGRDEIVANLKDLLRMPFEVVSHQAAVRPIHRNQYPVMGLHPSKPQLGFFNGLGSKGSLQAPFFADQFARALMKNGGIDPEVDLNLKTNWSGEAALHRERQSIVRKRGQPPLTQQAQNAVRQVVKPGETVIDATAGNGYDTQFLAELVGPCGTVYAFDIQPSALENTARRLEEAQLQNVILVQQDHAKLAEMIPVGQRDHVAAVMFNLGYLPGGNKQILTNSASTCLAITDALKLLRPEGIVTILAYTGHDGGAAEADAVVAILDQIADTEFEVTTTESQPGRIAGPRMFLVRRRIRN